MRAPMILVAFVAVATLGFVLLGDHSTEARFTNQGTSSANTFGTRTLQVPTLTATASGTTAQLSWTNPDSALSPSFVITRAPGTCASPSGAFVAIAGSPFASGTISRNDIPGTGGTYCYAVQSSLQQWLSAFGTSTSANQKSVTVLATISTLYLSTAAAGTCGTASTLTSVVPASGSVVLTPILSPAETFVATESLTHIPAGNHTVSIRVSTLVTLLAQYTVEIGTCTGTTFTSLGSATASVSISLGTTITSTVNIPTDTSLTGKALAFRITNTGVLITVATGDPAGLSGIVAPAGTTYR